MKKYRIALLFGGRGLEHDVSLSGAKYLIGQIDKRLFDVLPVLIAKDGRWIISGSVLSPLGETNPEERSRSEEELSALIREEDSGFADMTDALSTDEVSGFFEVSPARKNGCSGIMLEDGRFIRLSAAIPLLHGDFGEDGTPQGALENAGIPYIGCEGVASSLCYDKVYTKAVARCLGIPTLEFVFSSESDEKKARRAAEEKLSYPMFIKPARLGSSYGASPANGADEFEKAYINAYRIGKGRVLIEELANIEAELECGYYSSKSNELFTKIGEIHSANKFYDYEAKYKSPALSTVIGESILDAVYGDMIRKYSRMLVSFIGIEGISRLDFFLTKDGKTVFNEINTLPGFTESSLYPILLEISGLSVTNAITELLLDKIVGK